MQIKYKLLRMILIYCEKTALLLTTIYNFLRYLQQNFLDCVFLYSMFITNDTVVFHV